MKKVSNKTGKQTSKAQTITSTTDTTTLETEGTFERVPLDQIDIGLLNYRKRYNQTDLESFGTELSVHGVIHSLTLRKKPDGRFELVVGERRYRAAKIAQLKTVPAIIKDLTDEQVIEIMLAENMQRENPHPFHEAQGIESLYNTGKSIDEIAARLGKSKSYIYTRMKWVELIVPLQEMFLANKLYVQDVTDLSFLSPDAQQELFDQYCKDWEKPNFRFIDVKHAVSRFVYDLARAPFDTGDKNLIPEAGACDKCPFNSATIKTLFPEMAKVSYCTSKSCYKSKCLASRQNKISEALTNFKPDALLMEGTPSEETRKLIEASDELKALPQHDRYDVNVFKMPEPPQKGDYLECEGDEEEGQLDEESFVAAQQEYETDLAEHQSRIDTGKLMKGLCISNKKVEPLYFDLEKRSYGKVKPLTAKEVQQAIKSGTVTPELLTAEIERIQGRELRAKELDREKVQLQVYDALCQLLADQDAKAVLTPADQVAARLLVYQSASWDARNEINKALFPDKQHQDNEAFYHALGSLTDAQYAFMIRTALSSKPECKQPTYISGLTYYRMAESAGVDVGKIEKEQQKKATERESRATARVAELSGKAKTLFSAA